MKPSWSSLEGFIFWFTFKRSHLESKFNKNMKLGIVIFFMLAQSLKRAFKVRGLSEQKLTGPVIFLLMQSIKALAQSFTVMYGIRLLPFTK